jgi:lipopolysaccharide biosynthesis protein
LKSLAFPYEKISEIPWNTIELLDDRPVTWSDASLSFIFQHAGYTTGPWLDWDNYNNKNESFRTSNKLFDRLD